MDKQSERDEVKEEQRLEENAAARQAGQAIADRIIARERKYARRHLRVVR